MTDEPAVVAARLGRGRLAAAVAAIDRANAEDPTTLVVDGVARPKEVVHAERMTAWVLHLDAEADDAQLLAARAHHLRRWATPRSDFPAGRGGYLRWRTGQRRRHAAEVGEILDAVGYDEALVARVGAIVTKTGLTHDVDVQVHEDALCLVFLECQLDEVADKLGDEKMVDVLVKTMAKMRPEGLQAASGVSLSPRGQALVEAAAARRTQSD